MRFTKRFADGLKWHLRGAAQRLLWLVVSMYPAGIMAQEASLSGGFPERLRSDSGWPYVLVIVIMLLVARYVKSGLLRVLSMRLGEDQFRSPLEKYETAESIKSSRVVLRILNTFLWLVPGGYLFYLLVHGTSSEGYVMEWLNLLVRWVHVIAGVMWIGASFYFIFLENHLNRTHGIRDELAGNLWAIHGGGFYFLEKYKVAPAEIPRQLHWFKYEAYFTWLSGFCLLIVVYYMDAKAFLVDPSVADIPVSTAIAIGIGSLVSAWLIYDGLCKSPLIRRPTLFALIGFAILTIYSWFLAQVFNPRAAFIHMGALMGTLMAWNVYFVIIPSQKALVKAATLGLPLDATLGKKAGQRSLHNNYFTLPVLFIMISNHFPSTFGHDWGWVVLLLITLAGAGIKHYWNLLERGTVKRSYLIASILLLVGLAVAISPAFESAGGGEEVPYSRVHQIMQTRCVQCHSSHPTDEQWAKAPNGVMYDTPEQVAAMADKIMIRAVRSKSMPQGNKTGMTDEERELLGRWILQGAKTTTE